MVITELNDKQTQIKDFDFNRLSIWGGNLVYIDHNWIWRQFRLQQCSLFQFPIPLSWRVYHIIYLHLDHLDLTLVDHLCPYLSTYPIRHSLCLSMSCDSQDNTVLRSFPNKCGQKSSCSAFNTVVAVFPWIFLDFLLSRMFTRHVPIIGAFWRIILIAGIDIWVAFIISEKEFLLRSSTIPSLFMRR